MFGLQMGRMGAVGGASTPLWTPAMNFPLGTEPGLWYDPSTFTGLYQDSAGTSPATAVGQPNGLMLDKRLGLMLGPELSTGINASWVGATMVVAGSTATSVATANGYFYYSGGFTPVAGRTYEITFTISNYISGTAQPYIHLTPVLGSAVSGNGTFTAKLTATSTSSEHGFSLVGFVGTLSGYSQKLLAGNHISQPTASARPIIGASGGVQYDTFDGIDDGLSTGAITLGADMDCFIAIRTSDDIGVLFFDVPDSAAKWFGAWDSSGSGLHGISSGAATYVIDGTPLAVVSRSGLSAAITNNTWHIVEVRNLDLSTWTSLGFGNYGVAFNVAGSVGGVILCPAQSAATRTKIRQYLGAKVGLSL